MEDELRGPLPVKVDSTSNGEFRPVPLAEHVARANSEAEQQIGENAKGVGFGRRAFLQSLCGAATTFLTLNKAFAALGNTGGVFRLPKESAFETAAAAEVLAGDEFIFDVQTHMVDPAGAWRSSAGKYWEQIFARDRQGSCGSEDPIDCFSSEKYIKHVFMDSDTDLAVLSFVPELPENNPLSLEEANRVRILVNQISLCDLVDVARAAGIVVETQAILDRADELTSHIVEVKGRWLDRVEEVAFGDIGLSRNEGTRLAHGRFLSFLDGDNLWGEQWLRAAHEAARTPAVSEDIVWHPEHLYIFREAEFDRMPEAVASLMRASDTPGFNAASLLFGSLWSANGFARRAPYPLSISCRRSQPRDRHRGLVLEFGNPLGWGETSGCAEGRASSSTEESRVARPAKRHRSFAAAATSNIDMGPIALKHVPAEPFAAHLQRQHAT